MLWYEVRGCAIKYRDLGTKIRASEVKVYFGEISKATYIPDAPPEFDAGFGP